MWRLGICHCCGSSVEATWYSICRDASLPGTGFRNFQQNLSLEYFGSEFWKSFLLTIHLSCLMQQTKWNQGRKFQREPNWHKIVWKNAASHIDVKGWYKVHVYKYLQAPSRDRRWSHPLWISWRGESWVHTTRWASQESWQCAEICWNDGLTMIHYGYLWLSMVTYGWVWLTMV